MVAMRQGRLRVAIVLGSVGAVAAITIMQLDRFMLDRSIERAGIIPEDYSDRASAFALRANIYASVTVVFLAVALVSGVILLVRRRQLARR